jgi:hypothetical protein
MKSFIGKVVTISNVSDAEYMILEDDGYGWTDEMFEGLANEAPSIAKRINDKHDILNGLLNSDGSVDGEKLMEKLEVQNDSVNHPSHYTDGKIEVIEFIEDKKLSYHLGNACKYICRCLLKNGGRDKIQDLRKAKWYIERQIYIWEKEGEA